MPGNIAHVGATIVCPHGGKVQDSPGSGRVKVGGQPVALASDTYLVTGCTFVVPGPKPQPCVRAQWVVTSTRVKVEGKAVILQTSTGICQSAEQIPQGPPSVVTAQARVRGI